MKEAAFCKATQITLGRVWEDSEEPAKRRSRPSAELFIQITDDLSFASTKYPRPGPGII